VHPEPTIDAPVFRELPVPIEPAVRKIIYFRILFFAVACYFGGYENKRRINKP